MSEDLFRVQATEISRFVVESLESSLVPADVANVVADVYYRASLRGLGHHDIADFPRRLTLLAEGVILPSSRPIVEQGHAGVCRMDGANALGELCASRVMEEAMQRASEYGIGLATVRNSNHFLAAYPYVQQAIESGYVAMIMSRATPTMGTPGLGRKIIGNNPLGFGAAVADGPPFLIDMSWAYLSVGGLRTSAGGVPKHWGTDSIGQPTSDLVAIRDGAPEPIGGYKGLSMAFVVELLTGVLSDAVIVDEGQRAGARSGLQSQTAIVIDVSALNNPDRVAARASELFRRVGELDGREFCYAGERSARVAEQLAIDGVPIRLSVLAELDKWANRLGVQQIERDR